MANSTLHSLCRAESVLAFYDAVIILGLREELPGGVPYYFDPSSENKFDVGIQTMFDVESNVTGAIVVAGENLTVSATVVDIENNERLNNATADIYFDWGGPYNNC